MSRKPGGESISRWRKWSVGLNAAERSSEKKTEEHPWDEATWRSWAALMRAVSGPGDAKRIRIKPAVLTWKSRSLVRPSGEVVWCSGEEGRRPTGFSPSLNSCAILISRVTSLDYHQLFYAGPWVSKRPSPCPWITVSNLLTCIKMCVCVGGAYLPNETIGSSKLYHSHLGALHRA